MNKIVLGSISAIALLLHSSIAFSGVSAERITCQGDQGNSVEKCSLTGSGELISAQSQESDFFVSYKMGCNRSYRGPKPSKIKLTLNGRETVLNYNATEDRLFVGTGIGPVVLSDSQPNELNNYRANECSLVFSTVTAELSATEKAKLDAKKTEERLIYTTYLQNVREQAIFNQSLILNQQSNLYFRSGQRLQMGCLIQSWSADDLFAEVITDLKTKFDDKFGPFVVAEFEDICATKKYPALSFNDMTCSEFSNEGIQKQLAKSDLKTDARFFFETCSTELTYNQLLDWYKNKKIELDAKIAETRSLLLPDVTLELEQIQIDITTIISVACSSNSCEISASPAS